MTTRPLGAQISHMLKDRGVDVIFGIPGVHNQEMYRGIEEAGLRHVLARHEQGAGFMADGYARATGKPGVAYVITGPGLCNIMTPMGQAYSDSVPMLVISSCLDETAAKRGQLHQMKDQEGAARAVCDWSETARTAEAAYALIERAIQQLYPLKQRSRPIHISVPIAVLEGPAPAPPKEIPRAAAALAHTSTGLAESIAKSKRPLFIFGGGCSNPFQKAWGAEFDYARAENLTGEVLDLAGAACFTTYAGRGAVPPAHQLNFGSMLARPDSARVIGSADLVIGFGTDLSEVDLWRAELTADCPLVVVNTDKEILARADNAVQTVNQDVTACLSALTKELTPRTRIGWLAAEVMDFRAKMRAEIDAERPGILPVADALKGALPADTMIYSDMTQFAYAAKEVYPMDRPGHWHHPYGFGTLGYALPAAIGGKIGLGDQPVIAILGDYGFQYTVQELAVAVELELTLPIIIWDNGKLGEIEDSMVRAQIAPNAVVQRNPDFCKLAEAYGAAALAPTDLASFRQAITEALSNAGPTIIHVTSDIAL